MPEQPILKISEIFWSAIGEGDRAGLPAVFIRLSGCSLKCPYCDTEYAWDKGEFLTVSQITEKVTGYCDLYPGSDVIITGGEPLEQDLGQLVKELKKTGVHTAIETNGLHNRELAIDWWAVSPKDVANYRIHAGLIDKIDEIKLIVNNNLDLEVVGEIRELCPEPPVFLQPDGLSQNSYKDAFVFYKKCQQAGLINIRLGVQLQKVYGIK